MKSGGTPGVTGRQSLSSHPLSAASIFRSGQGCWFEVGEAMKSRALNCYLSSSGRYAVQAQSRRVLRADSDRLCAWDGRLGTTRVGVLKRPLGPQTLPALSFVTPDMCNDTTIARSAQRFLVKGWIPRNRCEPRPISPETRDCPHLGRGRLQGKESVATIVAARRPCRARSSSAFNTTRVEDDRTDARDSTYLGPMADRATASLRLRSNYTECHRRPGAGRPPEQTLSPSGRLP